MFIFLKFPEMLAVLELAYRLPFVLNWLLLLVVLLVLLLS
jgi:hypothetical protein